MSFRFIQSFIVSIALLGGLSLQSQAVAQTVTAEQLLKQLESSGALDKAVQRSLERLRQKAMAAQKLEEEKKAERENNKVPKPKKETFIVIKDLKGGLTRDDFVAAALLGNEGTDHATILSSIRSGTVDFNLQRKRKKAIMTFLDVLEYLKPKWLKAHNLKRLSPTWQQVIVMTPEQDSSFISPEVKNNG